MRDACLPISIVALFASIATALPSPSTNITISVPEGTSNHGNPDILCTPTQWYDIALFFLGNYIAHAATLKPYPGETTSEVISTMIVALLFPPSGAMRGLNSIFRAAYFVKDHPLKRAARAGALCMVTRGVDWKPEPEEKIENFSYVTPKLIEEAKARGRFVFNPNPTAELEEIHASETPPKVDVIFPIWAWRKNAPGIVPYGRSIHGRCDLPKGYQLTIVPPDVELSNYGGGVQGPKPYPNVISSSNNIGKTVVAALQTLYACFTLYRARGDQLLLYGYAAFGLTVAPYAVMGLVNLLGNLATPEYPTMYLVRSDILDEAAEREDAHFDGMVGELITQDVFPMFPKDIAPNMLSGSFELTPDGKPKPCNDLRSSVPHVTEGESNNAPAISPKPRPGFTGKGSYEIEDAPMHVQHERSSTIVQTDVNENSGPQAAGNTEGTQKDPGPIFRIPACNNYARSGPPWTPPQIEKAVIDPRKLRFSFNGFRLGLHTQFGLPLAIGALPIAIIAGLSRFREGSASTKAQRVWTMSWLAIGIYLGPAISKLPSIPSLVKFSKNVKFDNSNEEVSFQFIIWVSQWVRLCLYAVPAIGGFVVVGQMFQSYGSCIRL